MKVKNVGNNLAKALMSLKGRAEFKGQEIKKQKRYLKPSQENKLRSIIKLKKVRLHNLEMKKLLLQQI